MTGRGTITRAPKRSIRILLAAQIFWLAMVCLLGAWWGSLVLKQAGRIAELEQAAGLAATAAHAHWLRTQHMLRWEGLTYFILLLASTGVLFWFYLRDARRTRSLQAFFASLTHELRTPLTSIRLQAESISDSLRENAEEKELIQRLMQDTQRLELQVERILELARVEGGGRIFTQPVALRPWLERMLRDWRAHQDTSRDVQIHLDLGTADGVQILADQVAIQVILKNLLENSIRHGQREELEIRIEAQAASEGVFLVFRDNGRGFQGSPKYLGKLFEKGERSQGAGVGLYLVSTLMHRMGGFVRYASREAGFEVRLFFPTRPVLDG